MKFFAKIYKIGINPYVLLPAKTLKKLFEDAGKEKGNIPVKLLINEQWIYTDIAANGVCI